jgi:hypothetical protein
LCYCYCRIVSLIGSHVHNNLHNWDDFYAEGSSGGLVDTDTDETTNPLDGLGPFCKGLLNAREGIPPHQNNGIEEISGQRLARILKL